MRNRGEIGSSQPAVVEGTGYQGSVAACIAHPFQIQSGQHAAAGQEPVGGKTPAERLEQAQINSTPSAHSAEVQNQDGLDAGGCRLFGQAYRVRPGTPRVLHCRVENRAAQPQVEAEYDARRTHQLDDRLQIREGMERLQSNHDLTGAAGEDFQRTLRKMSTRIHQQRADKAGLEIGQLTNYGALYCPALDCIEVRDIALMQPQHGVKSPEYRYRITYLARRQIRLQRGIPGAVTGLRMHGNSTSDVQDGDDLHFVIESAGCK